jgi:hypothetical protein
LSALPQSAPWDEAKAVQRTSSPDDAQRRRHELVRLFSQYATDLFLRFPKIGKWAPEIARFVSNGSDPAPEYNGSARRRGARDNEGF